MLWWEVLLEIVRYTAPALIVYFTVFHLLKEHLKNERHIRVMRNKQDSKEITLPLRLQAYERLALFCERIRIPNLVMRLQNTSIRAKDMQAAMLITIKQEFEHNVAQQIYVSKDLWKIIDMAKNQTITVITNTTQNLGEQATAADLGQALFVAMDKQTQQPLDTALLAIKTEVLSIL